MTWTYTPDFTLTRDQIRVRIGDTDTTEQQLSDEEIAYAYTQAGSSVVGGAILCLEWLVSKYARLVDSAVGDLRISYSQRADTYRAALGEIRRRIAIGSVPVAGGVSLSRIETEEEDTDRAAPSFKVGMMDDPTTTESFEDDEDDY